MLEFFIVLLLGLALYLFHFGAYVSDWSQALFYFSDPDDIKISSWNTWHFVEALKSGQSPYFTNYLFAPDGHSLWMHAYSIYFGLIHFLVGDVELSINLGIALQLLAAFVGFYYLSKRWVSRGSAVGVAVLAVYNTYMLGKLGVHYNLVLIGLVPYVLILFFRWVNGDIKRWGKLLLFVLLIVSAFMDYYALFYSLSVMCAWWIYQGINPHRFSLRKKAIAVFAILGIGHFVARALRLVGLQEKGAIWAAADLRQLFTPSTESRYYSEWAIEGLLNSVNDNKIFIGWITLVLLGTAVVLWYRHLRNDRMAGFLLFASVLFGMVVLPVIRIGGSDVFYMFTGLIHYVPLVNNVRAPDRFVILLIVFAVTFSFYVLNRVLDGGVINLLVIIFIVLASVEHKMEPMNRLSYQVSSPFLSAQKNKAVLTVPFGIRDGHSEFGAFNEDVLLIQQQTKHRDVSGYLSRVSETTWNNARNSVLSTVVCLQRGDTCTIDPLTLVEGLNKLGLDAVYVHPTAPYATAFHNLLLEGGMKLVEHQGDVGYVFVE